MTGSLTTLATIARKGVALLAAVALWGILALLPFILATFILYNLFFDGTPPSAHP